MRYVWAGLATVVVVVVVLFSVQNSARTLQLSLDLGLVAWQLERPVPVPALLGAAFLVGLLVGAVPLGLRALRANSRVRELEARQALGKALDPTSEDRGAW